LALGNNVDNNGWLSSRVAEELELAPAFSSQISTSEKLIRVENVDRSFSERRHSAD
jgi:hypothetical protein